MSDLNSTVRDLNSTVLYESVPATRAMVNMPRMGHSSDFADLFAEDRSQAQDYGRGLLFGGILIICLFFTWSVVLLVLKCLGPGKVGFLSGAPFVKTEKAQNRPLYSRITFMVAGVTLITFGVLLVTQGVTNVRETITAMDESSTAVAQLVNDANEIAMSLRDIGTTTEAIRIELERYRGNFCPNQPDLEEIGGYNFDELAGQAIDLLNQLGVFLDNELVKLEDALDSAARATSDVDEQVENIDINDWQALIILIPIIIIPTFLMVGVMMAWNRVSNPNFSCVLNWFFLPLFVIIAVAAYVGSGGVAIAATANADWCSGTTDLQSSESPDLQSSESPDNSVLQILQNRNLDTKELTFRAVQFYVTQCRTKDDPWDFVSGYSIEIDTAETQVLQVWDAVDEVTVPRLTVICGRDYGPIFVLLTSIRDNLEVLSASARGVVDILRCSRIVPIYTRTVYEGTCTYSITGVTWIWCSLLVIAFCSLLMLTFRSAMQETVYEAPELYMSEGDKVNPSSSHTENEAISPTNSSPSAYPRYSTGSASQSRSSELYSSNKIDSYDDYSY